MERPRKKHERDQADALAALVESSDDAIYAKDSEGTIVRWNAAAEALYGYPAQEAIGRSIGMLIPAGRKGEEIDILERIFRGERVRHFETRRICKDGTIVDVSISVSPVHDEEGEIVEAAIVARDVTEQKQLQAAIEAARRERISSSRKQALELNDEVVQGLAVAKMAFEGGDPTEALEAVTATLKRAQTIVSRLLEDHKEERELRPGDLVRKRSSGLDV